MFKTFFSALGKTVDAIVWLLLYIHISVVPEALADTSGAIIEPKVLQLLETLNSEIKAKGYTHKVGPNPAMSHSIEAICGLVPPFGWERTAPWRDFSSATDMLADVILPSKFDWRSEIPSFPSVKNQGMCGSCWAFSTVGPLEFIIYARNQGPADLSEQYLLSCNPWGYNCDGGWFAHDMHINPGAILESDFPYVGYDASCPEASNPPVLFDHPYKIVDWAYIGSGYGILATEQIKRAIYTYGPVAAAVYVGSHFHAYTGGIFNVDEAASCYPYRCDVNHGVVLVGWDDSVYCGSGKYGAWILRNSWGPGWGEGGYMRICYGTSDVGFAANFIEYAGGPEVNELSIQIAGTGSGFVTSSPEGIECGLDCTGTYLKNSVVLLDAVPYTGSVFLGWDGGTCIGRETCSLTLSSYQVVKATFAKEALLALVQRYYRDILGRSPESGADIAWAMEIERLFSYEISLSEGFIALGKLFFNSAEYLSFGKTNLDYITDLYESFLGREPDQGGLTFWLDLLENGVTKNTVLTYFTCNAPEFRSYMESSFGTDTSRPEANLLNDLYRGFMSRLPDQDGFQYWLGRMREAQCLGAGAIGDLCANIAFLFTHSEEYIGKNRTNEEYIEDLYNAILRRRPLSPSEINFWLDELASGKRSRDKILQDFIESPEFSSRVDQVLAAGCIE